MNAPDYYIIAPSVWAMAKLHIIVTVFLARFMKYSNYLINNCQLNE